jgi:hypothetical protein
MGPKKDKKKVEEAAVEESGKNSVSKRFFPCILAFYFCFPDA